MLNEPLDETSAAHSYFRSSICFFKSSMNVFSMRRWALIARGLLRFLIEFLGRGPTVCTESPN
jgi:hypothetical protein